VWALWIGAGLLGWLLLATLVAVVIGRSIRMADRRDLTPGQWHRVEAAESPNFAVPLSPAGPNRPLVTSRPKRRRVPLPPIGVALAGLAVALEFVGYILRLSGARGPAARALSMDAPLSAPRMYITALFAAAAVAALSAGARISGRRTWWTAVGVVAAGVAFVKAGGTVHEVALNRLGQAISPLGAQVVSVVLAVVVVGLLWYLARRERRDRLRVLGSLALYAFAAVGLSAVSGAVGSAGLRWVAAATFVEESGEALGAVVFLVAVLIGVAPRLVLPADWALRRTADAHTLDAATGPLNGLRHPTPER
jgi:hypothetical protein